MARKIFEAVIAAFLLAVLSFNASAADDPKDTGPLSMAIQYKCPPGQRTAFRELIENVGLSSFAQWQASGILAGYHILFSRYVDTNSWDMLALLTFPSYTAVERWRQVEASSPAGLPRKALELTSSVETYPVDLVRQGSSDSPALKPVYFVIPYTITVPAPAYLKYADDYVRPQFDGWIKEGILSSYQFFMQRYTAGRPWDTLILLKYKDGESFGLREKIVVKVRAQLQSNPAWKAASDNKQNLRVEKQAIIADELVFVGR
jgi:hypothetical protein